MRIGIDAKFLTHPQKGGFKTYTENLVWALAEVDKVNNYFLYVDRQPLDSDKIPAQSNFNIKVVSASSRFYGMAWREQYSLSQQIHQDRLDVFHAPCLTSPIFTSTPTIVTIHDMIWYYSSRYTTRRVHFNKRQLMGFYYRLVPFLAAKRSKAIITVSNASKDSIVEYMKPSSGKIYVTYEAASSLFRPVTGSGPINKQHQQGDLKPDYILAMGSTDPRKNIKTLIKAYALLPDQLKDAHHLAIVWNHKLLASDAFSDVQSHDLIRYVHYLNDVSDEQLVELYNHASLFIFPSLEEGFGLPPLEAMACGTPVVAANNSSIPEIVGDAAVLFSAENYEELASSIARLLNEPGLRAKMKSCGIERAAKFSWKNCALETLDIYKRVVKA
jgi:glycosyltransferase involved in cell wall biosynthesis